MTPKMTTAQVVETSVTVTNSSFQNYTHPDDHTRQTTDTLGFKPFTIFGQISILLWATNLVSLPLLVSRVVPVVPRDHPYHPARLVLCKTK